MTIRKALGEIASLPYMGNRPGSSRNDKEFENTVVNILRNVSSVYERPNGNNKYPAFTHDGVDYQIKTAKGNKPMWNESYVRPDSILILNLGFGTVVVHGSLIYSKENTEKLIEAKNYIAKHMRETYPKIEGEMFSISGGRSQFKDNTDWAASRVDFLHKTIDILEGK